MDNALSINPALAASAPAATAARSATADVPPRWPSLVMAFAATCITVGIMWDISWHETIGRDTFWTPAHMTIYLGGVLGGCAGGWLAIQCTFLSHWAGTPPSVRVLGARAPIGAWVAIWGAVAMLTSGPFDNWWHNAYGLDVKIISPPHSVLGLGMISIVLGALLLVLTRQNHLQNGEGSGLFIYVGAIFTLMAAVFVMEYVFPNEQHGVAFYVVCALAFPVRLVTMGRAARTSWPATRTAAIYMILACLMLWVLPLFPAQPRLAPIRNPVTHMVAPPFPLLLIFPALAVDLVLRFAGEAKGWRKVPLALVLGAVFVLVVGVAQWLFSSFLISPAADNRFFGGKLVWDYGSNLGSWTHEFWQGATPGRVFSLYWTTIYVLVAAFMSWLGLLLGGWMRKVQR